MNKDVRWLLSISSMFINEDRNGAFSNHNPITAEISELSAVQSEVYQILMS